MGGYLDAPASLQRLTQGSLNNRPFVSCHITKRGLVQTILSELKVKAKRMEDFRATVKVSKDANKLILVMLTTSDLVGQCEFFLWFG